MSKMENSNLCEKFTPYKIEIEKINENNIIKNQEDSENLPRRNRKRTIINYESSDHEDINLIDEDEDTDQHSEEDFNSIIISKPIKTINKPQLIISFNKLLEKINNNFDKILFFNINNLSNDKKFNFNILLKK